MKVMANTIDKIDRWIEPIGKLDLFDLTAYATVALVFCLAYEPLHMLAG